MVTTNSSQSFTTQSSAEHTVEIVEVSAAGLPNIDDCKYKCRLSIWADGTLKLQKDLMARLQPTWLLDIQHLGNCTIALTLLYRQGGLGVAWQEAGTTEFSTVGRFERDRSVKVEQAITTWSAAPQLSLKTRLTQSTSEAQTEAVSLSLATQTMRSRQRPPLSELTAPEAIPEATPLSVAEAVVVKDIWNKLRAWKELQMATFFKRLLVEAPELEYCT